MDLQYQLKAGSYYLYDMREAPSRVIIAELFRRGATVTAYDPVAMDESRRIFGDEARLTYADRPMQALDGPTVTRVAELLRERIDAGWTPALLHATLAGNELPKHVHRLGGLAIEREAGDQGFGKGREAHHGMMARHSLH